MGRRDCWEVLRRCLQGTPQRRHRVQTCSRFTDQGGLLMVPVTFYNPDGQGGSIRFVAQGVRKEDSVFLNELSVDVSAEVDPDTYEEGWYILYFDYGAELADGTPNEVI